MHSKEQLFLPLEFRQDPTIWAAQLGFPRFVSVKLSSQAELNKRANTYFIFPEIKVRVSRNGSTRFYQSLFTKLIWVLYLFQHIHWVPRAGMDWLLNDSKISLVSEFSTLIMFQVPKPNFLDFNEMCPNVTSMTKWQRIGSWTLELVIRWADSFVARVENRGFEPQTKREHIFLCRNQPDYFLKKGRVWGRIFSFTKEILQEHIVQQKILPRWACLSSRPELFLILCSALLVCNKLLAAIFQLW